MRIKVPRKTTQYKGRRIGMFAAAGKCRRGNHNTFVAYAQQQVNTYPVGGSVSPTKAGTKKKPVPVGVTFDYAVGEESGHRPSPVKKYSIRFAGLRVNTNAFPKCSARRTERRGPESCPKGSAMGTGFIENATGRSADPSDRSIRCNAGLTVFNAGRNRAVIYVKGSPSETDPRRNCAIELGAPIRAKFVRRGASMALEFVVPSSLLHPLNGLDNAVLRVTSKIRKATRRVRGKRVGFFESVGGCKARRRAISVVFTPEQGSPRTTRTTATCRR